MSKTTKLVMTERGFQQGATQAMNGDIVRGLIELVTNADDAYQGRDGDIVIVVAPGTLPGELAYSVHDSATGLSGEKLFEVFTNVGIKAAHFTKGGLSRGLLGRGAKDCAIFGSVSFAAIQDGKYSELVITGQTAEANLVFENVDATQQHYEQLMLEPGRSGLTARINAQSDVVKPQPAKLRERLATDAQLRDLIVNRNVILKDTRNAVMDGVLKCPLPIGEEIFATEFELEGFAGKCKLVVRRLAEQQSTLPTESSANGLLVKSGATIFQNTWFALKDRTPSRLLAGELIVPQIVDVLREELASEVLPQIPLLTPTRDGLSSRHPLYKTLAVAVAKVCLPIFDQIAKETEGNRAQGEKLAQDFKIAANVLKSELASALKEIEDEDEGVGPIGAPAEFEIIPNVLHVQADEKFTLSLRSSNLVPIGPVVVESDKASLFAPIDFSFGAQFDVTWLSHPRLPDFNSSKISLHAPEDLGAYNLRISFSGKVATATIVVLEPSVHPIELPTGLEFHPSKVTVSPGRGKNLLVRAPLDYSGQVLKIGHGGTPIASCPSEVMLRPESTGRWAEAQIHIKTGSNLGNLHVHATTKAGEEASAEIKVVEAEIRGVGGLDIEFKLVDERNPVMRYEIESQETKYLCKVYANYKAYANVFGTYDGDLGKFKEEDSVAGRTVLAQVLSLAFAEMLTEREFAKKPEARWDAAQTNSKVRRYSEKFLPLLHRSLVSAVEVKND
jgi:hypothetical protein